MTVQLSQDDKEYIQKLLIKLISIPSVNTQDENGKNHPEDKIAEFITRYLQKIGMQTEIMAMPNGRPNVFARSPNVSAGKKTLLLSAHMDTVDIADMTIDPFNAKIEDNKIFGRGSCDTKASLAIYLWLLLTISDCPDTFDRDIQFLATCNEENGCVGSAWLAKEKLIKADEMIIGEPTKNQIATSHRGAMVLNFETLGVASHASVPHKGDNALYKMCDLIQNLRTNWIPKFTEPSNQLLGNPTASITIMNSGVRYNIVPEKAQATMDIRYLPAQSGDDIMKNLKEHLKTIKQTDNIEATVICRDDKPALECDTESSFVKKLLASYDEALELTSGTAKPTGLPFMTDASQLAGNDTRCVVFGPGSIEHAHSCDEFLEIDQLNQAALILANFIEKNRKA